MARGVGADQGRRHDVVEMRDEQLLRRVAHARRIVHHQRLGMDVLQQMRRRDVRHVERRILAQQDDVERRQVEHLGRTQGEVVALLAPELHRLGARHHLAVAEDQLGRRVVPDVIAAPLGLEPQHEGRIAIDVDGRHMVHLDGDLELHRQNPRLSGMRVTEVFGSSQ